MKIGIIGAGFIGRTLARLAVQHGYEAMVSNSRGPASLTSTARAIHALTGTVEEAVAFGNIVVLAIPFHSRASLPAAARRDDDLPVPRAETPAVPRWSPTAPPDWVLDFFRAIDRKDFGPSFGACLTDDAHMLFGVHDVRGREVIAATFAAIRYRHGNGAPRAR